MNNDLISREALKNYARKVMYEKNATNFSLLKVFDEIIDNAPTVELTETEIQEVLNKRCMTVVANEYLIALHGKRPQGKWIPVSERLPDDLEPVNITWINHEPEPYYKEIKDKPFTATGVYFNGQWYWWSSTCTDILAYYSHNFNDVMDPAIEVIAWQPLPEPYKEGEEK